MAVILIWEAEAEKLQFRAQPQQFSNLFCLKNKINKTKRAGDAAQCKEPQFNPRLNSNKYTEKLTMKHLTKGLQTFM